MLKLYTGVIDFDLLRFYLLPALAFLVLLLVFIYVIFEKERGE